MTNVFVRLVMVAVSVLSFSSIISAADDIPPIVPCLYIGLWGENSAPTCLTQEQLQRRAIALQCQEGLVPREMITRGLDFRKDQLWYIITGDIDAIATMVEAYPTHEPYRCMLSKARELHRQSR
ncbi:MAG: hypothetical protein GEU76_10055 [Alphaproteobacteria bacterium]|nr:hypothetical protein [Alphaproteobacteria bacterium]